jgi:hypothetical protein
MDRLCAAVLQALAREPLDPAGIREATAGAARSLGDAGKKKGLSTTLPVALGRLQARGQIRRVPINGRLDQQRYRYTLWKPGPLAGKTMSEDEAQQALARRFFQWVGPARVAEFQWFSGLGARASEAILAPLELAPIHPGSDRLLLPEDLDAFRSFEPPSRPQYALVSSLDSLAATRREIATLLHPADRDRKVLADGKTGALGGFYDLPNHAIFDRGRLIGLWEFDTESDSVVWSTFGPKDKALQAAVDRTETYIREQLGDARSFSLDSPASRAPKIAALRSRRA